MGGFKRREEDVVHVVSFFFWQNFKFLILSN